MTHSGLSAFFGIALLGLSAGSGFATELCRTTKLETFEFSGADLTDVQPVELLGAKLPTSRIQFVLEELPSASRSGAAEAKMVVELSTVPLHSLIVQMINNNMPASNCNDRYRVKGIEIGASDGELKIKGYLGYEKWECWYYTWICCTWFDCETCEQEVTTRLFEVSPFLEGRASLVLEGEMLRGSYTASVSDGLSDDQRNFLKALASVLDGFFQVATPVSNALNSKLDEVRNLGFAGSELLPFGLSDEGMEAIRKQFTWSVTRFEPSPDGTKALLVGSTGRMPKQQICDLQVTLRQQKAIAFQEANYVPEYIIQRGDNLWTLSETLFGDGRYFVALDRANPGVRIQPGRKINVPRLKDVISSGGIIRDGDTLWALAERKLGDPTKYMKLLGEDMEGRDPSKIYPLDVIQVPTEESPEEPSQTPPPPSNTEPDAAQPPPPGSAA